MNLLPAPRLLKRRAGGFLLPKQATLEFDVSISPSEARGITARLQAWITGRRPGRNASNIKIRQIGDRRSADIRAVRSPAFRRSPAPVRPDRPKPELQAEFYTLTIDRGGVLIEFNELAGLRAAIATLRQLLREHGRRLPRLRIRDWPDFPRRGVMLDVSRGRVPKLETLLDLADKLADFKINELQLYTEHTFAYRNHKSVWRGWGALTGGEIRKLDRRCCELGIDLVPNQNSFGHLREFLTRPALKPLAEISEPWPNGGGTFWRYPSTLAPNHPGTLPFLQGLYNELLPNFASRFFNVGCDETWDLGRGQTRRRCERLGKRRVYLDFLKRIHREVSRRGRRMMFWGDIILKQPKLIRELPQDVIALNWGYEANHPFAEEAAQFARAKVPFYVCPGTSTWATLVGKHDNAFTNLRAAAKAGRAHGAIGYLITDWGDGGHPQPLAVSWLPLLFGAATCWGGKSPEESTLVATASRDLFHDDSGHAARAALGLGLAHRKLQHTTPNATPLGTALAAPRPETHELFCRDGLKYYARIPPRNVSAALAEIENQRRRLQRARPATESGEQLVTELDLAARMAAQSCRIMLWQQTLAAGKRASARHMAQSGICELRALEADFNAFWPWRNKATPAKCSPFFQWRIADYLCARLHFEPEIARRD
jgi:hexosaminidase